MYRIRFARDVHGDLKGLRAHDRKIVVDAIEQNLIDQPTTVTRNRKPLPSLVPPWTAEPPGWELRIGDYRVFDDVAEDENIVYVRAVRKKPRGRTTEEIL